MLSSDELPTLLRDVKQALYDRNFSVAFGSEDHLEVYAARWSPTRALCYASVLQDIVQQHADDIVVGQNEEETEQEGHDQEPHLRMISIGGCAAEHVAFASMLHSTSLVGQLTLIDSGPWSKIANMLQTALTTPPPLSKYASAAAKASNTALVQPHQLSLSFQQLDILEQAEDGSQLAKLVAPEQQPVLVTLFFTLNELYTSGGIGKTTKFLSSLERLLPRRSLLLVVDSPGSYSEAAVGKEKKRYPMHWLLDHTLRDPKEEESSWERLESQDSIWFRLPKDLSYPMQLEDMRYQLHLYRLRENDQE